ncbi:MAG: hypothetical protein ACM3QW_00055 [Ignavibacteriales bacterium]
MMLGQAIMMGLIMGFLGGVISTLLYLQDSKEEGGYTHCLIEETQ